MNLKQAFKIFIYCLLVSCTCSSCFFYGKTLVYDDFEGIEKDSSAIVNILIIHGIGLKPVNYADDLLQNFKDELGLSIDPQKKIEILPDFLTNLKLPPTYTGGIYYIEGKSYKTNQLYRFFVVHWSPITYKFKNDLVSYDQDHRRSSISNYFKTKIVNQNFADIAAYTDSTYNSYIQKLVEQAFILTFKKSSEIMVKKVSYKSPSSLHVISGSFGSKIVLDVWNNHMKWLKKIIPQYTAEDFHRLTFFTYNPGLSAAIETLIVAKPINFFMLTNQLPLFSIQHMKYSVSPSEIASQSFVENDFKLLSENIMNSNLYDQLKKSTPNSLEENLKNKNIIIFNDPNDFLSYRVRKESLTNNYFKVSNISMRNAKIAIPYLIKFSNPMKAHENAFKNKRMHKMIFEGAKKSEKLDNWYCETCSY